MKYMDTDFDPDLKKKYTAKHQSQSASINQIINCNSNISYLAIFSVGTYLPSSPFERVFHQFTFLFTINVY